MYVCMYGKATGKEGSRRGGGEGRGFLRRDYPRNGVRHVAMINLSVVYLKMILMYWNKAWFTLST